MKGWVNSMENSHRIDKEDEMENVAAQTHEWYYVLVTVLGNAALIIPLWLWMRGEARSDARHADSKLEAYRAETFGLLSAIQTEMKDFHGRLCAIEERGRSEKRGNDL
jgi:hypothetical protein